MSFVLNFPLFLVVSSLLSSVISSLLNEKWARYVTLLLTFASTLANFAILSYTLKTNETYYYMMGHFPAPWGNELKITSIAAFFSIVFSLVLFLTVLAGRIAIEEFGIDGKRHIWYIMCDLIQAAILVLVYTNDLFTSYVFVEIMTLASTGLLIARDNGRTIAAATRYMIFALVGSGLFLFGIVFLYNITGHLLMPSLKESVAVLWSTGQYRLPLLASICFMVIGLAIKSGLFPCHFWMADTYGEAIPTSSGILSGVVSKAYIFLLIRIIFDVYGTDVFYSCYIHQVLFVCGALGIVFGSLSASHENNIFRMCAYSSAAQIGYIYLGMGISPTLGMVAALYQIVAHALTKPAIFLASYRLSNVCGNAKKFENIEGASKKDPFSALAFTFEALSMIGIPMTMGFISKFLFASGVFEGSTLKMIITLVVLIISTILNTIYFTRTIIRIYSTHDGDKRALDNKPSLRYIVVASLFIIVNIYFGVASNSIISLLSHGLGLL